VTRTPERVTVSAMGGTWHAETVGSLLSLASWSGEVASVHARAVNVHRPDGLVVSLLAGSEAMSDLGLVVPDLFDPDGARLNNPLGRPVAARRGLLYIDGCGTVESGGAARWTGKVQPGVAGSGRGPASPGFAAILARHGRPGGVVGLADPRRESPWSAAARRCLQREPPDLAALVGLGPGMTPSGDDFLAGALFALRLGWGRLPVGLTPARLRRAVAVALPGTTPAGRTLLWLALRGRFPAPLLALASAEDVRAAAAAVCGYGETSGTDMLVGCWWACRQAP